MALHFIQWHDILADQPPLLKRLLIITEDNCFGVGRYFEREGKTVRAIDFWIDEPSIKAGPTTMWALLPSKKEIKEENA